MLTIKNLTIKADNKIIIKNFSYSFEKEKIYVIMGPNGSGKSTLALTIMGHPIYQIEKGEIIFNNRKINELSADKRAKLGIFLSFQSPLSLTGINLFQLLKTSLGKKIDPLKLKNRLENLAEELNFKKDLLYRSLNESASGGERKKAELIQGLILNPKLMIFDEIDTGVDVDGLKIIGETINKNKKNKTYLLITHYHRIVKYLKPDRVLILKDSELKKEGDKKLIEEVEKKGYKFIG